MDECCCDEYTCTKMLAEEEDLGWNLHPTDSFGDNRETCAKDTEQQHKNYDESAKRCKGISSRYDITYRVLPHVEADHSHLYLPVHLRIAALLLEQYPS